jgi:hypothetical protein
MSVPAQDRTRKCARPSTTERREEQNEKAEIFYSLIGLVELFVQRKRGWVPMVIHGGLSLFRSCTLT